MAAPAGASVTYATPLTAWALTEAPKLQPPMLRDFATYADDGQWGESVLSMATHPAVQAGLARTPETVAEFDDALARLNAAHSHAGLWLSMSDFVAIVRGPEAARRDIERLDGLGAKLSGKAAEALAFEQPPRRFRERRGWGRRTR